MLVLTLGQGVASAGDVRIANAAHITKCLGGSESLLVEDCVDDKGASWLEPSQRGAKGAEEQRLQLQLTGTKKCVHEDLTIAPCSVHGSPTHGSSNWIWQRSTLQLKIRGKCLAKQKKGSKLALEECRKVDPDSEEQNGEGAPAEQTWVLFPVKRPQLEILSNLTFPLRTAGRYIIDSKGLRIKLVGVNWFGAHMEMLVNNGLDIAPMEDIAKSIKHMGFNSVRMSFASAMHVKNAAGEFIGIPNKSLVSANRELIGMTALEIFDRSVKALTDEGLLVVLNRHMGTPGWCCTGCDGNGLWFGEDYTTQDWLDSLTFMAERYKGNPRVIGVDMLNEPRSNDNLGLMGWWGLETPFKIMGVKLEDYRVAAARGAVALWKGNPDALVFVEGNLYGTLLQNVLNRPMKFADKCLSSRVVYSNHEYHWFWQGQGIFSHAGSNLHIMNLFANVKDIMNSMSTEADSSESDACSSPANAELEYGGAELQDYKHFKEVRESTVFWLNKGDHAPVWVGEFGSPGKAGNVWWEFIMDYFKESDVNWCYWALDPIKTPAFVDTAINKSYPLKRDAFGIFDYSRLDYISVVGWKLQDLIRVQPPAHADPLVLPVPAQCTFELGPNEERSAEPTSYYEFLTTMSSAGMAVSLVLAILLLPCICMLCACGCVAGCVAICAPATASAGAGTARLIKAGME